MIPLCANTERNAAAIQIYQESASTHDSFIVEKASIPSGYSGMAHPMMVKYSFFSDWHAV
jgi:hypothetical protein